VSSCINTHVHYPCYLPSHRNKFLQDYRAGASICGLTTTGECRYALVLQALCSIEFLGNVTSTHWANIQIPVKEFFIPRPLKFNPRPPRIRTHSSAGSRTRPANGRHPQPSRVNPPCAGLQCVHCKDPFSHVAFPPQDMTVYELGITTSA